MNHQELKQAHIEVSLKDITDKLSEKHFTTPQAHFLKLNELVAKTRTESKLQLQAGMGENEIRQAMVAAIRDWTRSELEKLSLFELEALVTAINRENQRFGRA